MAKKTYSISLPTEDATAALAGSFAPLLQPGDCLLLEGSIGAGKTAFARSLIRARLDRNEDVPSPTFTLVQTYEHEDGDIWHCDLYRLTHPDEAFELGLDDAFSSAICLIEWPDRLGTDVPKNAALLSFSANDVGHSLIASLAPEMDCRFAAVFTDA